MKRFQRLSALALALLLAAACFVGCELGDILGFADGTVQTDPVDNGASPAYGYASVEGIPDYNGKPYVQLNGNIPEFTEEEKAGTDSYELYSELDSLGRCGYTMACIGKDLMPTEERGEISSVKPSGWINKKYDTDLVEGGYIYNRCHLIGWQLTGENANERNLITGTRYLNIEGMLDFENMIADYIKETDNHVLYRVTPIFVGNNLLASGVKLEAWSVEDGGDGICFNVFSYNVQPGITISYATGDSVRNGEELPEQSEAPAETYNYDYVLNTSSKKIHKPDCALAKTIKEHNRQEYSGSISQLTADGYTACGTCKPA